MSDKEKKESNMFILNVATLYDRKMNANEIADKLNKSVDIVELTIQLICMVRESQRQKVH